MVLSGAHTDPDDIIPLRSGSLQAAQMDADNIPVGVILQHKKALSLPETQGTQHFLLRMVELVRHIGDAGGAVRMHHPQKVQVDLDLRVVGMPHIFIYKEIGHGCSARVAFAVYREQSATSLLMKAEHNERTAGNRLRE